jgi:predicted nucleotidyltransferase component of viral defense system
MITPDNPYFAQVRLLVRVLPIVGRENCFALKGGTAINLFVRDMPRLSVDIDLAFVPIGDRVSALSEIDAALARITATLERRPYAYRVRPGKRQDGRVVGLLVADGTAEIKIEVSPVLRGSVYPEATMRLVDRAEAEFGFAEVPVVSFADLYAGKIVAALDRQHPRDLFDVKLLLAGEGIAEELFRAFLVYLISHDGSIARVISPAPKPLRELFEHQFVGMTAGDAALSDLEQARNDLITALHRRIGEREKTFLLSFKQGAPRWELLGIDHAPALPAVRWKLHNLSQMGGVKHREALDNLERVLDALKT